MGDTACDVACTACKGPRLLCRNSSSLAAVKAAETGYFLIMNECIPLFLAVVFCTNTHEVCTSTIMYVKSKEVYIHLGF